MRSFRFFLGALLFLQWSSSVNALSLGDVHHQVRVAVAEIDVLKAHYSPQAVTRVPGIQIGKTTVHAYVKGLELLEKIKRFQREKQLPELTVPQLPTKRVRSKHILPLVELAISELRKTSASLNLTAAELKPDTKSKTASDLYEIIWLASYLMDALVEPIKPSNVLHTALRVEAGLVNISKRMNKTIEFQALETFTDKKPVDVTIGFYKILYKLAELEREIKLKPLVVPAFPAGKILPEDAFDAAGSVIADITRISLKLKKVDAISEIKQPQFKVTPNDVYAQVVRLDHAVEFLLK